MIIFTSKTEKKARKDNIDLEMREQTTICCCFVCLPEIVNLKQMKQFLVLFFRGCYFHLKCKNDIQEKFFVVSKCSEIQET